MKTRSQSTAATETHDATTRRFRRGRVRALVPVAVAAVVVTAGAAWATIPSGDGVINGCHAADGQLRLIDAEDGESCRPSEQALSWNQVGPAGPQGAQGLPGEKGEQGDTGETGPTGDPGVSGLYSRRTIFADDATSSFISGQVRCAVGDAVMGGGFRSFAGAARVLEDGPLTDPLDEDVIVGWRVRLDKEPAAGGTHHLYVWVFCAAVP